ncbi:hypothetical protein [Salininema proteolyticum]|uniref:Uncharacterized protein n=1 Tax=Salininema proteolyticum TaxID=1607685 RepID=A0ABV8U5I0_9ACTN
MSYRVPGGADGRLRTAPDPILDAARRLADHPHDHGWRELYRLLALGLSRRSPSLTSLLSSARVLRPGSGAVHLVTLFGIALRSTANGLFAGMADRTDDETRLGLLEEAAASRRADILATMASRQNSFTGTRRFLTVQVLTAAVFDRRGPARFADLGTGLGLLPRQLNSPRLYHRFAPGLSWEGGTPPYRPIPLERRYGVDKGPMPGLDWVRRCYGASPYYDRLADELESVHTDPELGRVPVRWSEFDLTDTAALRRFVVRERINAVNLSYLLYQLTPADKEAILATLRSALAPPGFILVTEPRGELGLPGCEVLVRTEATGAEPLRVYRVSSGHYRGRAARLEGHRAFEELYPIHRAGVPHGPR